MMYRPQDELLHRAGETGVNIFGAGRFARDVARALRAQGVVVRGFVTSSVPALSTLDGLPIRVATAGILIETPLWVGVFNRESHSDYAALRQWLVTIEPEVNIVWPQAFYEIVQDSLGFRFWLQPPRAYADFTERIADARALLADTASRDAFDDVIAFRREAFAASPRPHAGVQYLPDWLREQLANEAPLRLVDGGAYRGETLRELAGLLPVAQVWSFEPDSDNHAALVRNLADWPGPATHLPAGLSDRSGYAAFTSGAGEASHFSGHGTHHVPVVALDDCLHQAPVNFIKLDVEGHELAALAGARKTLLRQRPALAIAAYHRWDDLWRIPEFLAETGLDYRLRIGLHGHNSFDTVLYAT
jgi:FkbM family methyltransferase